MTVIYPKLNSISYSNWRTCHLAIIKAPKLSSLVLEIVYDGTFEALWSTNNLPFPHLRVLRTKFGTISYKRLVSGLCVLSGLEELHLNFSLPISFFKAFIPGAGKRLCSSLKVLAVTFPNSKVDKARYTDVFEKIAKARRTGPGKLESLKCEWPKKMACETQDFCERK